MDALSTQVAVCCDVLKLSDWEGVTHLSDVQDKLCLVIPVDAPPSDVMEAVDTLLPLAAPMSKALLVSNRIELIRTICGVIGIFAAVLGVALAPFCDQVVVALVDMTNRHRKSQSLWQAGETALAALTTHSRYDVETLFHCFDMTTSARKRRVILKQLAIILQCWHKSDLQPHFGSLKKLLHGAVHESRPLVRKDARATFCAFADMWLEHLDELVVLLSPAACQALRNEHPTARLSLALGKPTTTRIVDRNICVNDPEDPPETLVSDAALDDTPRLQEQLQRAQAQLKTLKRERAIERATWHMTEASMLDHLETLKYRLFKAQDDAIQVEKSLRHQLKTVQKALLQTKMCLPHETLGEPSDTASDDGSWTDTDDNFVHHDRVQVLKQRVEMSLFSPRDCLLTEPKDVVQSNPQPNESEPQDVQPPPSTQPARPYWIAAMSAAACAGAFFVASRWSK